MKLKLVNKTQKKIDGKAFWRQRVRRLPSTKHFTDRDLHLEEKNRLGSKKTKPGIERRRGNVAFENGEKGTNLRPVKDGAKYDKGKLKSSL